MNVCMVAYSFYESDTRVQQYVKALAQRGDVVDVIALRRRGQPSYEVLHGVNVHRIQLRVVNENGRLAYLLRILRFLLHAAMVLTRKHLGRRYQLIHVHSVPDFLVFAAIVPKLTKTPVILDIHDILPEFYASKFSVSQTSLPFKLLKLVERWSIAFSDHVIITNHLWYERLVSRSASPARCTTICNYPDPQFFFPRWKRTTNGKFIIMYPGTLNWHQGLDIAIRAFARVADQMPDAEFHIYGEGPTKASLMRLANELGLDGKVIFKEFVPTNEIARLMGEADLAVVPKRATLFGNEAQSTKVLEFMALGVPVIKTRTKIGTYYHDQFRVKFFEPEDVDDLANCMLMLKRDKRFRNELILNAGKYAQQNNWEVKKQDYLRLVDSLVARQAYGTWEQPSVKTGS